MAGSVWGEERAGAVSGAGAGSERQPGGGAPAQPLPQVLEPARLRKAKDAGEVNGRGGTRASGTGGCLCTYSCEETEGKSRVCVCAGVVLRVLPIPIPEKEKEKEEEKKKKKKNPVSSPLFGFHSRCAQEYVSGVLSLHTEGVPWWSFTRDPDKESEAGRGSCQKEAGPIAITVSEEVPGEKVVWGIFGHLFACGWASLFCGPSSFL